MVNFFCTMVLKITSIVIVPAIGLLVKGFVNSMFPSSARGILGDF